MQKQTTGNVVDLSPEQRRRSTIGSVRDLAKRRPSNFLAAPPKITTSDAASKAPSVNNKSPRHKAVLAAADQYDDPNRRRTSSFGGMTPKESAMLTIRNARLAAAVNKNFDMGGLNNNKIPVSSQLRRLSVSSNKSTSSSKSSLPVASSSHLPSADEAWNHTFQELFDSVAPACCRLSTINEQATILPTIAAVNEESSSTAVSPRQQPAPQPPQQASVAEELPTLTQEIKALPLDLNFVEGFPVSLVGSVSCSEEFRKTFDELFPHPSDDIVRRSVEAERCDSIKGTPRGGTRRRRGSQVHFFAPTRYP